jgi:TonB-linked SusC/RagA family outer membrane protein
LAVLALGTLGGAVPAAAQQGSISGAVTDQADSRPLYGARVQVIGTNLMGTSNSEGQYTIRGVPSGRHELRIVVLGYASTTQAVTLSPGEAVTLNWALTAVPFTLEEVVITAVGEQLTREQGNAVSRLAAEEIVDEAPVTSLSELLGAGRVANVTVLANDGTPGAGARIRIRGLSSASLSNDPLLYVDGIRVNERGVPLGPYVGGGSPSFLNDLNPEEIESIEIVKGPSASTLYGTQAANGVIRVVTKKGRAGPPRWKVYAEVGAVTDPTDYPAVYFSEAVGGGTCLPWQQAMGQCQIAQLHVRDLTEEDRFTFVSTALRQQYGAQVSGGTDAARYFISAEWENVGGNIVMPQSEQEFLVETRGLQSENDIPEEQRNPSDLTKVNLRANLGATFGSRTDLNVSFGFVNTNNLIPQTGDNLEGIIGVAIFGTADPAAGDNPWGFARPAYGLSNTTYRKSDHFTPSATVNFRPLDWLSIRGTAGVDYLGFRDENLARNGEACPFCGAGEGVRILNRLTTHKYSADVGATATFRLTSRLGSKTAAGVQFNQDVTRASLNQGLELPPGAETFTGAAVKTSSEQTVEFRTLGSYVEQQFSWDDRLFVTGAIRVDQNSAFGEDNRSAAYPKVSLSWVALENPDAWINQLRVRGAYGQSGQQPTLLAAVTYFNPINATLFGRGNVPAVSLGGLGNTGVKPERSGEIEAGFDATVWRNRLNLEFTYYYKETTDALVNRELPGSLGGVAVRLENVGTVTNEGVEVSLRSRLLNAEAVTWDVGLEFAGNRNRLQELAPGVPPLTGFGYRNAPGYPLFGNWWPTLLSYDDMNGDGIIDPTEITVSDTAVFLGNTVPTRTLGFSSHFGFFRNRLRLNTQVDYKGGYISHNINALFQCAFIQNCRELNDPNATLEEQAKAVAGPLAFGGWAEDGDHIRLREVGITYDLPGGWLRPLRLNSASVTFTGRNLALWTKEFTSWDPETLTQAGQLGDAAPYNFVQQAQTRTFVFRVNFGF